MTVSLAIVLVLVADTSIGHFRKCVGVPPRHSQAGGHRSERGSALQTRAKPQPNKAREMIYQALQIYTIFSLRPSRNH